MTKLTKAEAQQLRKEIIRMAPDFTVRKPYKYGRGDWEVLVTNTLNGLSFVVFSMADWKQRCQDQLFY